jgi:gluconate 5-dehydrogenase
MANLFNVQGKIALVTGSSRGIGFTLSEGLCEHGATVILNGRDEKTLEPSATALRDKGHTVFTSVFDVNDPQLIASEIDRIEDTIGPIGILVNNAGIMIRKPIIDLSLDEWNRVLSTHLTGAFCVSQKVARRMIERQEGKIVNICSMQSELARDTVSAYASAKGGLKMLTRSMTTEWAKYNIQINGIGPGYFLTDLTKPLSQDPKFDTWLKNRTPSGRWGVPQELIGTLIYLCSDASNYVNGHIVYVDGGLLAQI